MRGRAVQQEEEPGVRRDRRAPVPGGVAEKTQWRPGWGEAGALVRNTWSKSSPQDERGP